MLFVCDCVADNMMHKESTNAELPAANMKLIHSGKVLKDDQKIESCGIKQNDFLVVMVTKPKKAAAPAAAAAAASTPAVAAAAAAPAPAASDKPAEAPAAAATAEAPAPSNATSAPAAAAADSEFPAEMVNNLTGMGFPEAEVRHCLRAANGNPDVAVEFLTNGIPPGMQPGEQVAATSSSGGGTLAALRNHPQFNDLRRLVQSNPQMLQTVLAQIGQQQPELLAEINANQEAFLAMMNEPISENSSSSSPLGDGNSSSSAPAGGGPVGMPGIPPGMMEGMANPAQMAQLLQNMNPEELNQMAAMMGISADQLRTTAQMLGQIPPEQLQQYMMQAMGGGGGGGGFGGMMGGGGGPQVLRLTEEEMAAVDRLADMGFDRTEAAQAYLACDKNEALAANLLMDSMADGGGFGFGGGSGGDDQDGDNNDDNDGDDMYD
jgi:UV excision repair protein RAD23